MGKGVEKKTGKRGNFHCSWGKKYDLGKGGGAKISNFGKYIPLNSCIEAVTAATCRLLSSFWMGISISPPSNKEIKIKIFIMYYRVTSKTWPYFSGTFEKVTFPVYMCTIVYSKQWTSLYRVPEKHGHVQLVTLYQK